MPGLTRSLSDAMTAAGSSVTVLQQSDTFARLLLTGPEGVGTTVDLAQDARLADADLLWQHGRREGALLSTLVAVAGVAAPDHTVLLSPGWFHFLANSARRSLDPK